MGISNEKITLHGNPTEVAGTVLAVGDSAPEFTLTSTELKDIVSSEYAGKALLISAVPSLDTPTCDTQTKRINKEATSLSDDVVVLTVSRDLPFAQKRWCGAAEAGNIVALSDYKHREFGTKFGCAWTGPDLLARAVFVVDPSGKLAHVEYVDEISACLLYTSPSPRDS